MRAGFRLEDIEKSKKKVLTFFNRQETNIEWQSFP